MIPARRILRVERERLAITRFRLVRKTVSLVHHRKVRPRPGITRTDMTHAVEAKYDRLIDEGLLLQPRWGVPEDVGKAVAMLARGDLPYSTGQVIMVDGGLTVDRL